jgi:hypothetical protein
MSAMILEVIPSTYRWVNTQVIPVKNIGRRETRARIFSR